MIDIGNVQIPMIDAVDLHIAMTANWAIHMHCNDWHGECTVHCTWQSLQWRTLHLTVIAILHVAVSSHCNVSCGNILEKHCFRQACHTVTSIEHIVDFTHFVMSELKTPHLHLQLEWPTLFHSKPDLWPLAFGKMTAPFSSETCSIFEITHVAIQMTTIHLFHCNSDDHNPENRSWTSELQPKRSVCYF